MHVLIQKYFGSYGGRGKEDRWLVWGFRVGESVETVAAELHLTPAKDWPEHWNTNAPLGHFKDNNRRYYRLQSIEEFDLEHWPFG